MSNDMKLIMERFNHFAKQQETLNERATWVPKARQIINNIRRAKYATTAAETGMKGKAAAVAKIVAMALKDEAKVVAKRAALQATGAAQVAITKESVRAASSRLGQALAKGVTGSFMSSINQQLTQQTAKQIIKQTGLQLAKFAGKYALPWAFIGYEVSKIYQTWYKNTTGCVKHEIPGDTSSKCLKRGGNIQIWDWNNMKPAWTQVAVARDNPAGPGTEEKAKIIGDPKYKGSFSARDWKNWPLQAQLAFCKENGRKPMHMDLRSGDITDRKVFADGPSCEELKQLAKNQELDPNIMSLPQDA